MALQSEVSPPMVGDANKDTKIDGDTKSDDNSSQSTDEGGDLEEGEILDSGEEEGEEEKDFTNSSLKEALDKNCLLSIEQLVSQAKNAEQNSVPKKISPRKLNQMAAKYTDHDKVENSDTEDGWFPPSPKYKSKFEDKPIDYRMELAAYRGTPPSSPERKRRDDKPRKKRSSKKSKKSGKKAINRKDIKGMRVMKYKKEAIRMKSCKFFKEGKCAKGAECGFSHISPLSYKKKELCKFYLNGHCNKGKECLYMHSEFPCKFYHTGSECYAKDDCRFSHTPLTDEMKRILDAYLKVHHGDDDYEGRKRRASKSPEPKGPPPKRVCLLGSPPRHIREAEETKRWQEEMKLLQQQNHPGFEIHLSPCKDNMSPPQYPKPNFYQETLPNTPSPQKRRTIEASNPLNLPSDFPKSAPPSAFPANNSLDIFNRDSPREFAYEDNFIEMDIPRAKEEHDEFRWKSMHSINHGNAKGDPLKHFVEPDQQEQDFTSDVKFDETTQFSEMESSTDGPLSGSPATHSAAVHNKESEDDTSNQGNAKTRDEKLGADETAAEEASPQIVIPSHLPRKQRELFMRIQQHQRKNAAVSALADLSNSPRASENSEPQIKKEETDEDEEKPDSDSKDSKWYSSEDDDDDIDQPLTNVLKKLSKAPPPKTQEAQPKTGMNLIAMLNKIQQNTLERNKVVQDSQQQQQGAFWKNLLLGAVPPANDATPVPPPPPPPIIVASEPKRRTLLPDPPPAVKKEHIAPPKDPRLKNRDPRTAANSAASLPKPVAVEKSHIPASTLSAFPKVATTTVTSVTPPTEVIKESIPYRLHGIYTKPPNYTPYIFASQSNPKLLNDPRVRKHMNLNTTESSNENGKESVIIRTSSKDVPPVPELLLKYDKPGSLSINIFETTSSKLNDDIKQEAKSETPVVAKKLSDPRMRKRESRSSSGSDTPPLLSIAEPCSTPPSLEFKAAPVLENALIEPAAEKKWLPPVLEKSWTPPLLEKNWTVSVKKDLDSDSENSSEPPRLEMGEKPVENKPPFPPPNVAATEHLDSDVPTASIVPPVVKKVKPTPASHLPRAIADPRMAKLRLPLDSRRSLVASLDSNKSIVERKKPQSDATKTAESSTIKEISLSLNSEQESNNTVAKEKPVEQKMVKSIPKKRRLSDKSEEKKKTVHRNRKSSMDYASPLNSCDTNSEKSLGYNSYNQRPKLRTAVLNSETNSSVPNATPPCLESADTTLSDYLVSDNSNLECDNSNDVNLKDMFKTIDPTASPFC